MTWFSKIRLLAILFIGISVNNTTALAGQCDNLKGKAYGICFAATKGVKCNELDSTVTTPACERLSEKFAEITGETAPWETYGMDVEIYVDGDLQFFTNVDGGQPYNSELFASGNASVAQSVDGVVSLSISDLCDLDEDTINDCDATSFAGVHFTDIYSVPGHHIEFRVLAMTNLPDDRVRARCGARVISYGKAQTYTFSDAPFTDEYDSIVGIGSYEIDTPIFLDYWCQVFSGE